MIESIDEGWEIMTYSSGNLSRQSSLIDLVRDCAGKFLACTVQTNTEKTTWRAGGRLWTAWNLLGNYHLTDSWELKLEYPRLITIPLIKNNTYALFYEPPKWFTDYTITIYENKNMALYTDNTIQIPSYTSSTAAVTNITVSNNAAAISILPANANRKSFSIRNRGNKAAFIGFNVTLTANTAFLSLAAGATYESEKIFTGEIFGLAISANSATDLTVTEFA